MAIVRTADPEVVIESQQGDTTIYRRNDGVRWSVKGVCDRRGFCLVGAVIDGVQIKSVAHIKRLCKKLGKDRIDSALDVPLGPAYKGDCCPMKVEVLDVD